MKFTRKCNIMFFFLRDQFEFYVLIVSKLLFQFFGSLKTLLHPMTLFFLTPFLKFVCPLSNYSPS